MKTFALRLAPESDMQQELIGFARRHNIGAACILTCVGSLRRAALRFAGRSEVAIMEQDFEILALSGTLSDSGSHLHLMLADKHGVTIGGHVKAGCIVRTTAELVIASIPGLHFTREFDSRTGFEELTVREK